MKVKNNMKKINKTYMLISFAVGTLMLFVPNVFAAGDDPIAVVNNLSDFIFQITRVVGSIIVGIFFSTNWIIIYKSRRITKSKWFYVFCWWSNYNVC